MQGSQLLPSPGVPKFLLPVTKKPGTTPRKQEAGVAQVHGLSELSVCPGLPWQEHQRQPQEPCTKKGEQVILQ